MNWIKIQHGVSVDCASDSTISSENPAMSITEACVELSTIYYYATSTHYFSTILVDYVRSYYNATCPLITRFRDLEYNSVE